MHLSGGAGTVIAFAVPDGRHPVEITLLDASGRQVGPIASGVYDGGSHRILFEPTRQGMGSLGWFASGRYFYRMRSGAFQQTRMMTILK